MTIKIRYCVLLALLLHFLLLLSFTTSFSFWLKPIDPPEADAVKGTYLPAYVSEEPKQSSRLEEEPAKPPAKTEVSQSRLKPHHQTTQMSSAQESDDSVATNEKAVSTLNLVSDKKIDKPLLKLLSKATSAKLTYPKTASDFGLHGKVTIRFLVFPSGTVSDVTLIESSGSGVLDQAALDTINAISPVSHVDQYLKSPEHVVVGIIYS